MIRIQFDIQDEDYQEYSKYMDYKDRHSKAKEAFKEWLNRKQSRDLHEKKKRILADKEFIKPIIREIMDESE